MDTDQEQSHMEEDRISRLERRLEELEKRESATEKAMQRSRAAMGNVVPLQTRQHMRAAGREQLLIIRSLLDHWVKRLDAMTEAENAETPDQGRQNIPID